MSETNFKVVDFVKSICASHLEDKNIEELLNEMSQIEEEKEEILDTYFISGHRNLTENEFEYYYIPLIYQIKL